MENVKHSCTYSKYYLLLLVFVLQVIASIFSEFKFVIWFNMFEANVDKG